MNAGQRLAAYGRHGDNNLVHVSDRELRGIETLTGRRFTKNPATGLPEAFSFADLIPIAAGIGATVLTGGNPLAGAAAAGATRTGVSAAQGKDAGSALMDGVIAGATGYATAGLMEGVGALGVPADQIASGPAAAGINTSTTPLSAFGTGATKAAENVAFAGPSIDVGTAGQAATGGSPAAAAAGKLAPTPPYGPQLPLESPIPSEPGGGLFKSAAEAYRGAGFSDRMGMISDALQNRPTEALGQLASGRGLIAAGGTYAQLSGMFDPVRPPEAEPTQERPENFPAPRQVRMPGPDYRPGVDPEFRYFAEGGLASLPQANNPDSARNLVNEAAAALLGEHPKPQRAIDRFVQMFGEGALDALQDRLAGGRVRGSGGGLDDLVPGDIEGRQRVRLADGEFVVPADVVSGLGDGSTDHGVRKLHEMMDRVRRQRTGKTEQPGHVDDDEVLPA